MTIANEHSREDYTGTGLVTVYPYAYKILDENDIEVIKTIGAVDTVLAIGLDYTVSGVGLDGGGNVTLAIALAAGAHLAIVRSLTFTQPTDIKNQGDFFPEVHEDVFDRLVMLDQQQQDGIDRSLKIPLSEAGGAGNTLPNVAARKGLFLAFDAVTGAPIASGGPSSVPASAFGAALIAALTAAAARLLLGFAAIVAKGDLWVGTAADTVGRLAVGANNTVLTADSAQATGVKWVAPATVQQVTIRQTVLQGLLSAAGIPGLIAIGVGLNADLKAATLACYLTFANGFSSTGSVDYIESLNVDTASYWAALPASNTSYLSITRTGAGVVAAGQTLAPPQYGDTYNQAAQSILLMGGANNSIVFLDDFGNTWTRQGGAKVTNSYSKFGTGSLGGAGATNALDGANDFLKSTNFTGVGNGSWAVRFWVKPLNALPAVGQAFMMFVASGATNYGIRWAVYNNGGTIRFSYALSSTNTSDDITGGAYVQGTTLPVLGTEYFIELTYDALAGVYRMYVNGVQESTTASALRIHTGCTAAAIGSLIAGGAVTSIQGYITNFELLPYCNHPAGTAYAVPVAAPSITAAGYASDWFDTSQMVMRTPSAASAAAAANPTFTNSNKLYVGEADTGAAAVSAVRTYAYQRKYMGQNVTPLPGASTQISASHNIGVMPNKKRLVIVCLVTQQGYNPGDEVEAIHTGSTPDHVTPTPTVTKNLMTVAVGNINTWVIPPKAGGAPFTATTTSWAYRLQAERTF